MINLSWSVERGMFRDGGKDIQSQGKEALTQPVIARVISHL